MIQVNPGVLGGLLVDFGDKTSESRLALGGPLLTQQSTCPLRPRSTDSTPPSLVRPFHRAGDQADISQRVSRYTYSFNMNWIAYGARSLDHLNDGPRCYGFAIWRSVGGDTGDRTVTPIL